MCTEIVVKSQADKRNTYINCSFALCWMQFSHHFQRLKTEQKPTQPKHWNEWNENEWMNVFDLIITIQFMFLFFFIFPIAEADVEFKTKLSARGLNDAQISGLQQPSVLLSSLEDYVRNVFTRYVNHFTCACVFFSWNLNVHGRLFCRQRFIVCTEWAVRRGSKDER